MLFEMSEICLIFGGNGQDGYYLGEQLSRYGAKVIKISRTSGDVLGDVSSYSVVAELVEKYRPKYIFHVAATSSTRHEAILENYHAIVIGACNILEAVKRFSDKTKVLIAGSGLQFVNTGSPISEYDAFCSGNAYSLTRNSATECARYYRSLGISVYLGYLFHHESPLRKPTHISKKISLAAQRIAAGNPEKLEVGNAAVKKEWAFAGDIAEGMIALISQDRVFEATIGTGVGYTIEDWLTACFSIVGLKWQEHVFFSHDFSPEYVSLVSNPSTIFGLGWRPRTSFEVLADMMMRPNDF